MAINEPQKGMLKLISYFSFFICVYILLFIVILSCNTNPYHNNHFNKLIKTSLPKLTLHIAIRVRNSN